MNLWQDVRFGARLLVKDRWFTLAAATALALGIGANAAVFTLVNVMLLRDLPFHESDRIMSLWTQDARGRQLNVSELDFEDWRAESRAFSDLAAFLGAPINVSDEGRAPERVKGAYVTGNLFGLIWPAAGDRPRLHDRGRPTRRRAGHDHRTQCLAESLRQRSGRAGTRHQGQ